MDFRELFRKKALHRVWQRLDDGKIVGTTSGKEILRDQAYYVFRMTEMYLRHSRKLWRKMYPMLHAYVEYRGEEDHAVAGPGQLKQIDESNLDRVMTLNYPLSGPAPYLEAEVHLLVGLYSIPGEDLSKALLDSVSAIAGLANIGNAAVGQVINVVKGGVQSILQLDSTALQLGVSDHFYPNNPLRSGYHVAIAAPPAEVDFGPLWLVNGRLVKGTRPERSVPYEDHDYMVIEVERRLSRDDWPRIPEIAAFQKRFADILGSPAGIDDRKTALNQVWREFDRAVRASNDLITPDKTQILKSVHDDLKTRLELEPDFEFESVGWGGAESARTKPAEFDFVNVPDRVDTTDPKGLAEAERALEEEF